MEDPRLIYLIEIIFFICILIVVIIKNILIKNKSGKPVYNKDKIEFIKPKTIRIIPLIIFMFCIMCISVTIIPSHFSMLERAWMHKNLPDIFSDYSKKYSLGNNSIILNYKYKTKLIDEYLLLRNTYGSSKARKVIISIISDVLKTELPKSNNIDTLLLFNKIDSIINDTLSTLEKRK